MTYEERLEESAHGSVPAFSAYLSNDYILQSAIVPGERKT